VYKFSIGSYSRLLTLPFPLLFLSFFPSTPHPPTRLMQGGPTMQASGVPYQRRTEGAATINRRKAAAKIEAENRLIADRLRNHVRVHIPFLFLSSSIDNRHPLGDFCWAYFVFCHLTQFQVAPVIDRQKHAAEYEKATAMRRNISAAAKRADRTALARRRAADALMASSAPASLSGGGLFDQHGDYAHGPGAANAPMLKSMGSATGLTQVRTAQDVRATVAAGRGEQLPEWLTTSKSAPRESRRQKPRGAFSLSHTGAPAAPVMHPPPPIPM